MNIVFLTMSRITGLLTRGIYTDLMRKFRDEGHRIIIVSPRERSLKLESGLDEVDGVRVLGVKTLNLQKTSIIEKGIGQIMVEGQFKRAIKRYLYDCSFDLILYSTPPITFPRIIKYLKIKNPNAKTYLLLKDIFPQNAVDIGMMSKTGLKGILYRFFRKKEKVLYSLSDYIGCMSPANVDYVLKHNPELSKGRVEIAPNSIELIKDNSNRDYCKEIENERSFIRSKYNLPNDRPIFIYGGNLGKPQGIPFLIRCLEANSSRKDCHFVVVGNGTERARLESWYMSSKPRSVTIMNRLPKEDYDLLAKSCDVGLIFLDHRFTIPNFPSRLLPYLENKIPIIAATDPNCDTGKIAEENGFGYWCESDSVIAFTTILDKMIHSDRKAMGERGYEYLCKNYLVSNTYETIIKHV